MCIYTYVCHASALLHMSVTFLACACTIQVPCGSNSGLSVNLERGANAAYEPRWIAREHITAGKHMVAITHDGCPFTCARQPLRVRIPSILKIKILHEDICCCLQTYTLLC